MKVFLTALLMAVITIVTTQRLAATYSITDLGTLGGDTSYAYAINQSGQIVGKSDITGNAASHATLFSVDTNGIVTLTDLGAVGTNSSEALCINDDGVIGGDVSINSNLYHLAIFNPGSGPQDFDPTNTAYSSANLDVNNQDQFAGFLQDSTGYYAATIVLDTDTGNGFAFGPYQNQDDENLGVAINNSSMLTGYQDSSDGLLGFMWLTTSNPSPAVLLTNPSTPQTAGLAINNNGYVAGISGDDDSFQATVWSFEGTQQTSVSELGTLSGENSFALGINDSEQIVGDSGVIGVPVFHGFVYTGAGGMQDLNSLVGPTPISINIFLGTISQITDGLGNHINNWGQIAAAGTIGTNTHALLLNPATPPTETIGPITSSWLLGGGNYGLIPPITDTRSGSLGTIVNFRDGLAGNATNGPRRLETVQFEADPSAPNGIASDTVNVSGSGSDMYVLQLSFITSNAITYFANKTNACLCSYKGFFGQTGSWLHNAVDDNVGGHSTFAGIRAYNASTDFHLGTYGVDTTHNTAWAVLNHGGTFGVSINPDTVRRIQSLSRSGTVSTLKMSGFTGYAYQLQHAFSLGSGFANVRSNVFIGTNGTTIKFTVDEGTAAQVFYRVEIIQ